MLLAGWMPSMSRNGRSGEHERPLWVECEEPRCGSGRSADEVLEPQMQSKLVAESAGQRTFVLVLDSGEEAIDHARCQAAQPRRTPAVLSVIPR